MQEPIDLPPPRPGSWCHFHDGESSTALPVQSTVRNSGPDMLLRACAPCREQRGLKPIELAS